jgi:D-glycero-alpha-D-manno-heptose-7-phosphate kinase
MILSRTPLRVSFFGGGTDYPEYFERHLGAAVGMAIKKYVYISCLRLESFIDYRYRIGYRQIESVASRDAISHPVIRALLAHYNIEFPLDISIFSDLPARTGLGGSSAFTVGFLNLIFAMLSRDMTRIDLGRSAIHAERHLLEERVGSQDQMHAAYGGMNKFTFHGNKIGIYPVQIPAQCLEELLASLILIYTGRTRSASATLDEQITATRELKKDSELHHLAVLADQAVELLQGDDPEAMIEDFGAMMQEGWMTKKKLSSKVSNPTIDTLYAKAMKFGAVGGKLCGAGSGGFLLMVVPRHRMEDFKLSMADHSLVPVELDTQGSTILRF